MERPNKGFLVASFNKNLKNLILRVVTTILLQSLNLFSRFLRLKGETYFTRHFGDWVPKSKVQNFFKYGNTTMTAFAKNNNIRKTKVGNRVFYNYEDIVALLESNIE